ncbi:MAG: DMT family transporter [Clostridia bacterium]|nr:DMT family transporter [Clostridia bacterium]
MMTDKKKIGIILVSLIVMLLWGSLFSVVKLGYKQFHIDTAFYPNLLLFAGIRFSVSGFIIVFLRSAKNKFRPLIKTQKEWGGVLLLALFAVIMHYGFTYFGLSVVASAKTALLKQSGVIVFIFLSFLIIKEDKFSIFKLFGAVFGIASIIILNLGENGGGFSIGEIYIVLASVCTVAAGIVCKKLLSNTDAVMMTGISELLGGLLLLIAGLSLGGTLNIAGTGSWLLLLYLIAATCVSYILWYSVVQKYELSKLFIIKLSEPLFAAVIGAVILEENIFNAQYLISFFCVIVAVVISNVNMIRKTKTQKLMVQDVSELAASQSSATYMEDTKDK